MDKSLVIVFPLFQRVTYLDFIGPLEVLAAIPGAEVIIASVGGAPIRENNLTLSGLARLEDIGRCDVLCVPGSPDISHALLDDTFLAANGSARASRPRAARGGGPPPVASFLKPV